jgi:hypothetical protein
MRRALASAGWALAALVLTTACAEPALRRTTDVGGVWVGIGSIEPSRLDASLRRSEGTIPEQLEDLFDLFWEAGCAGEHLRLTRLSDAGYPEVVCSLPGRSKRLIVVFTHIDLASSDSEVIDDWRTAASLPTLYRSLGAEPRTHTFAFASFGEVSRRASPWRSIRRLAEAADAEISAVVDLRRLLSGHHGIWYYSADSRLRDDLLTVGRSVGRSPDSIRRVPPPDREERSASARRPREGIPAITIGTFAPRSAAGVASAPPQARARADAGEMLRLVAFFLGYIDQRIAVELPPGEDVGSVEPPTGSAE